MDDGGRIGFIVILGTTLCGDETTSSTSSLLSTLTDGIIAAADGEDCDCVGDAAAAAAAVIVDAVAIDVVEYLTTDAADGDRLDA